MAEFSNVPRSSATGWIIGVVAVVAVLLLLIFAGGLTPTASDGTPAGDATAPAVETAPVPAEPAPAANN